MVSKLHHPLYTCHANTLSNMVSCFLMSRLQTPMMTSNYNGRFPRKGCIWTLFEIVHFLNIQNKQSPYITHSASPHLHLINRQNVFCFFLIHIFFKCKTRVTLRIQLVLCYLSESILYNINIVYTIYMTRTVLALYLLNQIYYRACPPHVAINKKGAIVESAFL